MIETWDIFNNTLAGKKLFLFGVGNGMQYFFNQYGEKYVIEGVIDNDCKKHDFLVEEYIAINPIPLIVSDISILKDYDIEDVVVLITSLKHFNDIANQLERYEGLHYFSLIFLEPDILHDIHNKNHEYMESRVNMYNEFPIEDKKVVFYTRGSYSGHGKAIAEQFLERRPDLDIVWIVDDLYMDVPKEIRLIYRGNLKKYMYEMLTAQLWIYEELVPLYINKRNHQKYIQLKHWSSITLKTFGLSVAKFRGIKADVDICRHNTKMMDYIFVGSEFDEQTCRREFEYKGETVYVGSARSDVLFKRKETRKKVLSYYSLDEHKRYILYAPTFRYIKGTNYDCEVYPLDLNFVRIKHNIEEKFGGEWNILLRLHPFVAKVQNDMELDSCVTGVSDYPDSQELVAACDVMITDYSSIMFEPAFVKKPVFLYAPDRKDYIDVERGLLIDYDSLPFPIAESNDELVKNIQQFDKEKYDVDVQEFLDSYGVHEDGHASERAAKFISDLIP